MHTRDDKASVDDAGTHIVVFVVAEATWPDADDDECERLGGDTFPAIDDEATTEGAGTPWRVFGTSDSNICLAGEPWALC